MIEGSSVFTGIPPSAGSLEPYLAPYGYLAVNETRVATHSGRNVASESQSNGKAKRGLNGYPALDKGEGAP